MKRFFNFAACAIALCCLTAAFDAADIGIANPAFAADEQKDKPVFDAIAASQADDEKYEWTNLFDGKSLYTYSKQSNEVTISEPEQEEVESLDPTAVLSSYKTGYKIDKPEEGMRMGHKTALIKLYPEDLDESFFKVEMLIDVDANMPLSITTYSKNGVTNCISILSIETNLTIPDKEFAFSNDRFPGAEIVDIR